jgi:hypothetical protein
MNPDHPDVNLERHIERKISKFLNDLAPHRREGAAKLCNFVTSQLDYNNLQKGIVHKFEKDIWRGKRPTIHFLNQAVNAALRKIRREVYAKELNELYVSEFGAQLVVSLRSICRYFDPLAKCWKRA